MDAIGLRADAPRLHELHRRFAPCFKRRECQEHSLGYLRGLLPGDGRKRVEPMAPVFGAPSPVEAEIPRSTVLAWQRFLTVSPRDAQDVQRKIQAVFKRP